MYLPLAGYKKKKIGAEMSVDSISASLASRVVQPPGAAAKPQQEMQEVLSSSQGTVAATDNEHASEDSGYAISCSNSMSTQDFLSLRSQTKDEPFAILDEVIAKMKENMEEVGDALEAIFEMAEQTSESEMALQLLEKMSEATDEMSETK
tara:strand:- start:90 stop:539 length:450 start_codon:yes stop_codon:yes gene_type:complete